MHRLVDTMAICKFCDFLVVNIRHRLIPCLKIIVPLMTCIALTYCSSSLYVYLTNGHHVEAETVLLRMMQCAAFVAPTTAYLFQTVKYGPVLFIGGCFTILGVSAPSLIADYRKQEVAFAVLFGTGISIVFQATTMASSTIFRANIFCSVLLLGLCSTAMFMARPLFENVSIMFPVHTIITGTLVLVAVMFIFPAVADMIGARRFKKTVEQDNDDPLLNLKTKEERDDLEDEKLLTISQPSGKEMSRDNETDTNNHAFMTMILEQMGWRLCALLWWSLGINLGFLSSSREPATDNIMVSLMCLLSLFTFGVKVFLTERQSCRISGYDSDNSTGYFVLGLLGINGLMLRFYPLSTDVHCFSLLFSMGFFHHLQPSHKMPQIFSDIGLIINQICVELALTFCALVIGYQVASIINNNVLALIKTSASCSDASLLVVSVAILLLSLRYGFKKNQNSKNPTVEAEYMARLDVN